MKYLFLFPCLGLLSPTVSKAQTAAHVRIGFTAGGSLLTATGKYTHTEPAIKSLAGVVGGLVAQLPLTSSGHLFLQPELIYNQEGYGLTHPATKYTATFRSSYVSLPLLLGFTTHGLFVMAGPQVGYLAGMRRHFEYEAYDTTGVYLGPQENTNTDLRGYNRWEASLVGAVGYRLRGGLGLEVRYTEALTSAQGGNVFNNNINPRNATGQVRLSYLLH